MAFTTDDFNKVWASTSPLTPYEFSESNYKEGWNFIGATPPSRQMWDSWLKMTDEKCQYLYNHEDVPVGHEYFTFNPNIPQGSLPLFGGEYSRETYSALWNWVQEQTGYLKTEAEWQTLATANNGNVPYYSDGDGSTTFRVPALNCWMRSANGTVSEVGSYLQAGLPNITGGFDTRTTNYNNGAMHYNYSGALYQGTTSGVSDAVTQYNGSQPRTKTEFDASRSSAIYGNSNTVQPSSVVGMWLVKAYGKIVDTGQIDEQQYIDDRIATCLPLSGGTMTGNITLADGGNPLSTAGGTMTGKIIYNGSNSEKFSLGLSSTTNVDFGWDYGNGNGAMIGLRSNSDTNSGEFEIFARNASLSKSLIGKPDGTLTWADKNVERVNASGTNYIRYESGLQITWQSETVNSTSTAYTFPVPFNANPIVASSTEAASYIRVTNVSTTGFKAQTNVSTGYGSRFIAIGKWK